MLTAHFVAQLSTRYGKHIHSIPPAVALELESHDWPGNVRELERVIERALISSTDGTLRLAEPLIHADVDRPAEVTTTRLTDIERQHIQRILAGTAWRIEGREGAASALGLHPSTLRSRMLKLGIRRQA